ncbi:nucleotidyltransferase domain-containing protein [Candidatus Woesearchaeota archaeon]|nr:nucleotidyltransferase domain-containing protein [Candidatus Woesearchaeota archaeon]
MKPVKFKKTELIELNEAYKKTLYWFFSYPTKEVSLNDLTKRVNISKTTANTVVRQLATEGFLKINKLGNIWRITCDQQHPYNMTKKIAYNLELIYEAGIIEAILSLFENPVSIALFGSYRKGDDTDQSDIDIAVETLDNEEPTVIKIGTIQQFGYRKNVNVNILKFSRNKIDINLFANLVNGIVLYGFLEARV